MYTDSEGLMLKQTKAVDGKKIITLLSKKYGKISCQSKLKTSNKHANIALGSFVYSKYQLYKNREFFSIISGEIIKSYYSIGEDIVKYGYASYVLELTEKILEEGHPVPRIFNILIDYLNVLDKRKGKFDTVLVAYELKLFRELGIMPNLRSCVNCGKKIDKECGKIYFDVKGGGVLCSNCINTQDTLIFKAGFGMIEIIDYCISRPLQSLKRLALNDEMLKQIKQIIKYYKEYHLDLGSLKSEVFLKEALYEKEVK